ncbi:Transposase DDE domain protein [Pseudobythopirellula maris]|uniref:Transposase DDE domain protein n=1 Tax=Pseudobythopirellula maris TaxID=2527991 RepID=A0A5C5ZPR3_9BACT|nr:IS4 family transposase [Pseudobythopirellula maris]TWT89125.1 Transposase DDE domain protein [Pseudobythopirellula maris]
MGLRGGGFSVIVAGMASKKQRIRERDVQGVKQLEQLLPLLERLHTVGCGRDKAGNRSLHMDQYCMLILLFFFNPIFTSLRGLQQASELKKVQRKLRCPRTSLGSLSESARVFDSEGLKEIIGELAEQLNTLPASTRMSEAAGRLTAVDGTLLAKLPQITHAAWRTRLCPDGWKMHTHFEVLRGVPVKAELTDGRGKGDSSEKASMRRLLEADRCYVMDRGYEQFSLFNAIVAAGSSYVCRVRGDHHFAPRQSNELSQEALDGGVLDDAIGKLGSEKSVRIEHPDHDVRVVRVRAESHPKRGGRRRHAASQDIVLATNLHDVPAEVVALMYRSRWQIEIFFRFFKHVLGCRRLLSQDREGIEIQTYCGVIVCMLISLWTGRQPTLRTFEMICLYLQGWADDEEVLAHLQKLKPIAE